AGWAGEQVVWSSYELPYVATYSEAAGRLAFWVVSRAQLSPELLGDLPDIPAATPLPAGVGGGVGAAAAAGGVPGPMTASHMGGLGLGLGPPGSNMSLAAGGGGVVTPASRVSMFS
ncbi:hypothetical protein Agub_g9044, partial [Astrephomene gubernaculifera]